MNILLLIVGIVLLCNIADCYKKGMVKAIISFISLVVLCIVVALISNGLKSYFDGDIVNVVIMVLLFVVISIAHKLLGLILYPAKLIAKLPIIHSLDKLLGVVFGILETVLILWTIYTFIMILDMGMIGQQLLEYTQDSDILLWFYQHNYLAYCVEQLGAQFNILL